MSKTSELIDPFGRKIEYVRLSVTDRCNLRCFYCMPKKFKAFEEPEHWLDFNEIERVVSAFSRLGVSKLRITGGEPLVRKNLPELTTRLSQVKGLTDLSLSTNAVHLGAHAEVLWKGGVTRLNVSLDSLKPERFKEITGGGKLSKVIDGLMQAKAVGFAPIKINMVAMKGINDDEFEDMVEFCIEHGFTLRLIETMPVGDTGRLGSSHFLNLQDVKIQLSKRYNLVPSVMSGGGPARYVRIAHTDLRIGFITPMSQHFCETCNRVRLSVDGTLYLCLGQDNKYELRPLLRAGIDDSELEQHLLKALALKPKKHEFSENPGQVIRLMSMTGG